MNESIFLYHCLNFSDEGSPVSCKFPPEHLFDSVCSHMCLAMHLFHSVPSRDGSPFRALQRPAAYHHSDNSLCGPWGFNLLPSSDSDVQYKWGSNPFALLFLTVLHSWASGSRASAPTVRDVLEMSFLLRKSCFLLVAYSFFSLDDFSSETLIPHAIRTCQQLQMKVPPFCQKYQGTSDVHLGSDTLKLKLWDFTS